MRRSFSFSNSRELIKSTVGEHQQQHPSSLPNGLLTGMKAKAADQRAVLDLLGFTNKSSRSFAVLSGVVDAGVAVPHSEEKIVKDA